MKKLIMPLLGAIALVGVFLFLPTTAFADVAFTVSADFGPPPLPYYSQPPCPGAGFIWTPGYWAFDDDDDGYFWVPGSWVLAPAVGLLWTPGWWGWDDDDGRFWWHPGYWGWHVGFYGGINYGYGYSGDGYWGGYWDDDDDFHYNREVNNVDTAVAQYTYDRPVRRTAVPGHVSYNGGAGGIALHETSEQRALAQEQHFTLTDAQLVQQRIARENPAQHWSVNHGAPQIVATVRAGDFSSAGVVRTNPKEFARHDFQTVHVTPGEPGFKRARHIESIPVARPEVSHSTTWLMPARHEVRQEPVIRIPRGEPVRTPREHNGINITVTSHHVSGRAEINLHHKEKVGRPPN